MTTISKLCFTGLAVSAMIILFAGLGRPGKSMTGGNSDLSPVGFTSTGLHSSDVQDVQDEEELQESLRAQARQDFMRGKLVSNQQIVEGLTTNDFGKILEGSRGVISMVKGQHWFVIDDPEYRAFSAEMEKIAGRLDQAANNRNMEAATLRYFELTLNCIDCHRYIEGLRLNE